MVYRVEGIVVIVQSREVLAPTGELQGRIIRQESGLQTIVRGMGYIFCGVGFTMAGREIAERSPGIYPSYKMIEFWGGGLLVGSGASSVLFGISEIIRGCFRAVHVG